MENTVVLELLDKSGKVTDSQEITITTDELPDKLDDAVKPVKTSGESAFELTMVYGQRTTFPFAYDLSLIHILKAGFPDSLRRGHRPCVHKRH